MLKAIAVVALLALGAVIGAKALSHHGVHSNFGPTGVSVSVPNPLPASGGPQQGGNIYVP